MQAARDNLQTSIDDSALATRARTGDLAAFNALVETHQDAVYGLCLRMLASSSHAAEDVTQDVFLAAYRRIDTLSRRRLPRLAAANRHERLHRRAATSPAPSPGVSRRRDRRRLALDLPDESESPEESALRGELSRYIQAGLMALPRPARSRRLCDVQGLSYEEVSEALHVSLGTVKSRLSRGRARLRDLLLRQRELLPHPFRHTV